MSAAPPPPRSHEPVFWLLFAAGGLVAAFALPALILVSGMLAPAGALPEGRAGYEAVSAVLSAWPAKLVTGAVVSLLFWHAMHRIFHGLHDLGVSRHLGAWRIVCYGFAFLATLATFTALALI